jgi:hypothetical protein
MGRRERERRTRGMLAPNKNNSRPCLVHRIEAKLLNSQPLGVQPMSKVDGVR